MGNANPKSAALAKRARALMPGGVSSPVRAFAPFPRCMARGKGPYLWDVDGHRYVDLCLGFGPLLLGHASSVIARRVSAQARRGSLFGAPCEDEPWVAERLHRLYPSLERVRFVSTGGEAVTSVLRLARAATGKAGVVKMDGGFHGSVDPLLVKAGSGAAALPSSAGVVVTKKAPTYVVPFNDLEAVRAVLERHDDVGLLLVEPALGNMGLIPPVPGYLASLRRLTQEHGVLLAFDEVITGFRAALGGAQERWSVSPDLTVLGKVLGGGLPIAVYGGRRDLLSQVAPEGPVYQAGTFSGNPLSLAAARGMLETLTPSLLRSVEHRTSALARRISRAFEGAGVPVQVPTAGSMLSIFLASKEVLDAEEARKSDGVRYLRLAGALLDEGVYLPQSPFETLFLSTTHGATQEDEVVGAFERVLARGEG